MTLSQDDLERLQQILFYREALLEQRELLLVRKQRLERLVRTIDHTLECMERSVDMDNEELFDGFDPKEYEDEAREKWGHTDAWAESKQRTDKYTKDDWKAIMAEGGQIFEGIAGLMHLDPSDPKVQELISQHRQYMMPRTRPYQRASASTSHLHLPLSQSAPYKVLK